MSNQPYEYFGGTPTQGYRKKKSILEGVLEDVKQSPIYGAVEAAAGFGADALGMALGSSQVSTQAGISTLDPTIRARAAGVPAEVVTEQAKQAQAAQTQKQVEANAGLGAGPIGVALGASEAAWSYGVARPTATGNLLLNPQSPLYKDGVIEQGTPDKIERVRTKKGFQWDDVRQAWNRSEQVTTTQAAVANPIIQAIPGLDVITSIGGINAYDPWSVYDMSRAQDNPYYRFVTGGGDLALQVAVPTATKITRLAAMEKAGLRTTVRNVEDLDKMTSDWTYHKEYEATGGVSGHRTAFGEYVDALARETKESKIRTNPFVANAEGIDKAAMANIISRTTDKDTLANLLLATWGDNVAMKNLMDAAPDHVWTLSDMDSNIQNAWINGTRFAPEGESLVRVNQIFDSAIARDEYFTNVRDMFVRGVGGEVDGKLVPIVGSTWMPTKRIFVEKTRMAKGRASYSARTADYSDAPKWVQTVAQAGPGAPATIFLQWVGSRQPLGHVSKSGARPNDIWDELSATFDSIPQFRGQREVTVDYVQQADGTVTPVTMPAAQYRQNMFDRLTEANSRGTLLEEWRAMEDEIVRDMARTLNVDPVKALKYVEGYRKAADDSVNYIEQSGGYLFDERGGRILLDAQTQRQLLNSFPTSPLREIYDSMQYDEAGIFRRAEMATVDTGVAAFDAGLKFFRTNVLFRPGYTGKNSIIEPLLSSYLAHGTILSDEGLLSTARNVGTNISNRLKRTVYLSEVDTLINKFVKGQPAKTRRLMRNEMNELVNQRYQTQMVLDTAQAELDNLRSGRVSKATAEKYTDEVRGALVDAQLRLDAIDAALDARIPEWRQIVEPARLTDVRRALEEYKAMQKELKSDGPAIPVGNKEVFESLSRDAKAAGIKLDDPRGANVIANTVYQYRAKKLIEDNPSVKFGKGPGDTVILRLDDDATYAAYMKAFYPQVKDDTVVTLYRGLKEGEDIFVSAGSGQAKFAEGYGSHWTFNPVVAAGFGANTKVVSIDIRFGDIKNYEWGSPKKTIIGPLNDVDAAEDAIILDYTKIPDEIKGSVKTVDIKIPSGSSNYYDGLNKISTANRASEISDDIAALEMIYDDIIESASMKYEDPARKIELASKEMELIDKKLAALGRDMGARREKIAETSRYAGSGEGYMTLDIGGEKFQVPAAFSDRPYDFGSGFRAEASAAGTNRLTLDPSYRASYEVGRWQRTGDVRTIDPNDPIYFDELAHVANRFFRGDKVVQIYLETGSREAVARFLVSKEGRKYQKSMNKEYLAPRESYSDTTTPIPVVDKPMRPAKDIPGGLTGPAQVKPPRAKAGGRRVLIESTTELDELLRIVDQYLPSRDIQAAVAVGEVTPGQLQRMMSGMQLSRISGEDMMFLPQNPVASVYNKLNQGLDKIWQFIATMPEDRIARWPFYQREFKMQMERRGEILTSQGVKLTNKQFAALRQASHRDALSELEKTFYNIRRYNSAVYMSRFLMSFPGAFFNSIYRYGRFAAKEPERVFQSLLLSNDILTRGAVDEDGNPVDNLNDATYFVIPGTKREPGDTGMRIPIGSLTSFAVNYPGLSYASTVMVSAITSKNPSTEEKLKDFLGSAYDEMFPYGIPRDWESTFLGSYQKDLIRSYQGESNEQFIQTNVQIYSDSIARWERDGRQGTAPTFQDAIDDTVAFYNARAGKKFISAFPLQDNPPGQLMRDAWYAIREEYPDNQDEARKAYIEQYGEWARWYTYSSSDYTAYLPSTQKAYERIWVEYPDITREIASLVGDDNLEYVSLLAIGTDGQFSQSVSNFYRDTPLPGDDVPLITRMNPESFENMVRKSDGWDTYSKSRILFDTEMTRLRELRDNAGTEYMKDKYRDEIDNLETGWKTWVEDLAATNEPWGFDFNDVSSSKAKNAASILKKIINKPSFKNGPGREVLWQNVDALVTGRDAALEAVKNETEKEAKDEIRRGFVEWVNNELIPQSPELVSVWERYFSREWTEL